MRSEEGACRLRAGYVSKYDPARHMAKVTFPENDDLVSGWLHVLVPNVLKNHDEHHVDVGEHVMCLLSGSGTEAGVVIGAIYDDKNKPLYDDRDVRRLELEDGTSIELDRKEHEIRLKALTVTQSATSGPEDSGSLSVTMNRESQTISLKGRNVRIDAEHVVIDTQTGRMTGEWTR